MCLEESEQGDRTARERSGVGDAWGVGVGVGQAELERSRGTLGDSVPRVAAQRRARGGPGRHSGGDRTPVPGGRREPVRRRSQEMLQNLGCGVPGAWPGVLVELSRSS